MPEVFNSSEEETLYMLKFTQSHKFPSQEKCNEILWEKIDYPPNDKLIPDMIDTLCYEYIKIMYEKCDDNRILETMGTQIFKRSDGFKAMTMNLYALSKIIRYLIKNDKYKYCYAEQIILINNIKTRCEGLWVWDNY